MEAWEAVNYLKMGIYYMAFGRQFVGLWGIWRFIKSSRRGSILI